MKLPLEDGDEFVDKQGRKQKVMGSILKNSGVRVAPEHEREYDHSVCWTLRGDWFRRADGVEMTGAGGCVQTVGEFFKDRREGRHGVL
jgi:hypothetical protein